MDEIGGFQLRAENLPSAPSAQRLLLQPSIFEVFKPRLKAKPGGLL
jgi:hypothetical protein